MSAQSEITELNARKERSDAINRAFARHIEAHEVLQKHIKSQRYIINGLVLLVVVLLGAFVFAKLPSKVKEFEQSYAQPQPLVKHKGGLEYTLKP